MIKSMTVFGLCLILVSIFFIKFLYNKNSAVFFLESSQEAVVQSQGKDNSGELEYDFYQRLRDQTIEVIETDEYQSTSKDEPAARLFIIQAASFKKLADADQLKAILTMQHLDVYIKPVAIKERQWYRVYVGPFSDRSSLNYAQDVLVQHKIVGLVLTQEIQ